VSYQSTYPPSFSSTATYANRYDLDEIDVFLEDDGTNPMFFNVDKLPSQLSYGKHYFTISILDSYKRQYRLADNSRILFEFKSWNNVILKSDVVSTNTKNGVVICYVEVLKDPLRTFKEVEDGEGTLTLVGTLDNKSNTVNRIPQKFKNEINYRCTFPINIRKNINYGDGPVITNVSHTLCTGNGQFPFGKVPISAVKNSKLGLTYNPSTGKPNISYAVGYRRGYKGGGGGKG